jgi:soluble lytic murein transglycosylase-like protein
VGKGERAVRDFIPLLQALARALGIEWELLAGQIEQESSWDPAAVGDSGTSFGLGQIKLATAQMFYPNWTVTELLDPVKNIVCMYDVWRWAQAWLRGQDIVNADLVLAVYNWGSGNVARHLQAGKTCGELPPQVLEYVQAVHLRAQRIRSDHG